MPLISSTRSIICCPLLILPSCIPNNLSHQLLTCPSACLSPSSLVVIKDCQSINRRIAGLATLLPSLHEDTLSCGNLKEIFQHSLLQTRIQLITDSVIDHHYFVVFIQLKRDSQTYSDSIRASTFGDKAPHQSRPPSGPCRLTVHMTINHRNINSHFNISEVFGGRGPNEQSPQVSHSVSGRGIRFKSFINSRPFAKRCDQTDHRPLILVKSDQTDQ